MAIIDLCKNNAKHTCTKPSYFQASCTICPSITYAKLNKVPAAPPDVRKGLALPARTHSLTFGAAPRHPGGAREDRGGGRPASHRHAAHRAAQPQGPSSHTIACDHRPRYVSRRLKASNVLTRADAHPVVSGERNLTPRLIGVFRSQLLGEAIGVN